MDKEKLYRSFEQLKDFCERSHFKGYDPYDGLNSTLFQSIPFMAKTGSSGWHGYRFLNVPHQFPEADRCETRLQPQSPGAVSLGLLHPLQAEPMRATSP